MDILSGVSALTGVLHGASKLVQELKRPKLESEDFLALLQQEYSKNNAKSTQLSQQIERVEKLSEQFISKRDTDGDGLLSLEESGLQEASFRQLDSDGDGRLSLRELKRPFVAYLEQSAAQQSSE